MNCVSCNKELQDNAKFCRFCGASQTIKPQPVITPTISEQLSTEPACKKCGNVLLANAKFCKHCGEAVSQTVNSTPTPAIREPLMPVRQVEPQQINNVNPVQYQTSLSATNHKKWLIPTLAVLVVSLATTVLYITLSGMSEKKQPTATSAIPVTKPLWCDKASTYVEITICTDQKLIAEDAAMYEAYKKVKASTTNKEYFYSESKIWRDDIRNVCSTKECLVEVYQARTAQLNARLQQLSASAPEQTNNTSVTGNGRNGIHILSDDEVGQIPFSDRDYTKSDPVVDHNADFDKNWKGKTISLKYGGIKVSENVVFCEPEIKGLNPNSIVTGVLVDRPTGGSGGNPIELKDCRVEK